MAMINQMINRGTQLYQGFASPPDLASELRKKKGVTSANTTIHNARVSLMVVATSRALTPWLATSSGCIWSYAAPAPTTEDVSCMAIAAHMPNCFMVMPKASPIEGNKNKAMPLRTNTTPKATDMLSAFAFMTGPTAAIADPPHIAVPELSR